MVINGFLTFNITIISTTTLRSDIPELKNSRKSNRNMATNPERNIQLAFNDFSKKQKNVQKKKRSQFIQ